MVVVVANMPIEAVVAVESTAATYFVVVIISITFYNLNKYVHW